MTIGAEGEGSETRGEVDDAPRARGQWFERYLQPAPAQVRS